jgi:hypothetical protein
MWALAWKSLGREPWERTQFPIATTEAAWRNAEKSWSQLSPGAVSLLNSAQPYHQGDLAEKTVLARLAKLDNDDKHRTLTPTLFGVEDVSAFPKPGVVVAGEAEYTLGGPLEVGTRVVRFRVLGPPGQRIEMEGQLAADVSFDTGLRVKPALERISRAVEEAINAFEQFL